MKKFKTLWYMGIAIVGIPMFIVGVAVFFAISNQYKTSEPTVQEEVELPKVDTVVVEKRVVVRDTVYIKPKPIAKPVVIQDTL